MSRFFIDRPKLAWVVAIFILLAGLLAIPALPVAQFPNVAPPQISISATYPGASATSVTAVLRGDWPCNCWARQRVASAAGWRKSA